MDKPEVRETQAAPAADNFHAERMGQGAAAGLLEAPKDTAKLHQVQIGGVENNAADPGQTTFKMQDALKPENQGLSHKEILLKNGMPADNKDGGQDKFINKFVDNSFLAEVKAAGIKVPDNPTDSQLGDLALQMAIVSKTASEGDESVRKELGVDKNASMDQMIKKLGEQVFPQVTGEDGKPVKNAAEFYKVMREQNAGPVRVEAGVKRPN